LEFTRVKGAITLKIETYEQKIAVADEGKWLYNTDAKVFATRVRLGKNADPKDWVEITESEKQEIEEKLEQEMLIEE
jgi:hypothetical protein